MEKNEPSLKDFKSTYAFDKIDIGMDTLDALITGQGDFKIVKTDQENIFNLIDKKNKNNKLLSLYGETKEDLLFNLNMKLHGTDTINTGGKRRTRRHKKNKKSRKNRRKTYHRRR